MLGLARLFFAVFLLFVVGWLLDREKVLIEVDMRRACMTYHLLLDLKLNLLESRQFIVHNKVIGDFCPHRTAEVF